MTGCAGCCNFDETDTILSKLFKQVTSNPTASYPTASEFLKVTVKSLPEQQLLPLKDDLPDQTVKNSTEPV